MRISRMTEEKLMKRLNSLRNSSLSFLVNSGEPDAIKVACPVRRKELVNTSTAAQPRETRAN